MTALKNILVGVDFSSCSRAAVRQAARLATANSAALHVLHVVDALAFEDLAESTPSNGDSLRELVLRDTRADLEALVPADARPADAHLEVVIGQPLTEVLRAVGRVSADLLVLGIQGASGQGADLGTFAVKCARKAPTRVLLVKEQHGGAFRHVAVGVDFSETSAVAVQEAVRMAAAEGSKLSLVHVFDPPWHRLHYKAPTPQANPAYQREYLRIQTARLQACMDPFPEERAKLKVSYELIEFRRYADGILDHASKNGVDLLVLGTRGRSNLRYVLLGSTAERVLRGTPCSVLTVKPPDFMAEPI